MTVANAPLALVPDEDFPEPGPAADSDLIPEALAREIAARDGMTLDEIPLVLEDRKGGHVCLRVTGDSPRLAAIREALEAMLVAMVAE